MPDAVQASRHIKRFTTTTKHPASAKAEQAPHTDTNTSRIEHRAESAQQWMQRLRCFVAASAAAVERRRCDAQKQVAKRAIYKALLFLSLALASLSALCVWLCVEVGLEHDDDGGADDHNDVSVDVGQRSKIS